MAVKGLVASSSRINPPDRNRFQSNRGACAPEKANLYVILKLFD
jgi:hypothetical protein